VSKARCPQAITKPSMAIAGQFQVSGEIKTKPKREVESAMVLVVVTCKKCNSL